jgi:hypothetical protein
MNRLLVKFKPSFARSMSDSEIGIRHQGFTGSFNVSKFTIADGSSVENKIKELESLPGACMGCMGNGLRVAGLTGRWGGVGA